MVSVMVALSVVSSAGNDSVWLLEGPVSVSCRSVIVEDSAMKGFFLVADSSLSVVPIEAVSSGDAVVEGDAGGSTSVLAMDGGRVGGI